MSLENTFPGLLGKHYAITSPATLNYNCVAWAAGRVNEWWWPIDDEGVTWPAGVALEETVEAFRDAFATLGFAVADSEGLESGFEKIALFANAAGVPLHAARQLPNGSWTSKLGELEDIEHELHDLEGDAYGAVTLLMKRYLFVPVGSPPTANG